MNTVFDFKFLPFDFGPFLFYRFQGNGAFKRFSKKKFLTWTLSCLLHYLNSFQVIECWWCWFWTHLLDKPIV